LGGGTEKIKAKAILLAQNSRTDRDTNRAYVWGAEMGDGDHGRGFGSVSDPCAVGAHICYIYHDDEERRGLISSFVRSGLSAGEAVAYFAGVAEARLTEWLEELGILPVGEAERNRLAVTPALSTCCPGNSFVPETLLARLREVQRRGCADGMHGARVWGEMSWALRGIPGSERLVEFESRINSLLAIHPMTVFCEYDIRRFDGATAFDILGVHPMMVACGQVIRNPYFLPSGGGLAAPAATPPRPTNGRAI
jgi:hypothetical protein